ncbi:MAG TPA: hypothetical protein VJ464_07025 [Blastocatellia bacterium]|nr:hypothetical protein [Blastocatellia bacterium]
MPSLRLRPWPFDKNSRVLLYWICSPFKDTWGFWRVRVAFLDSAPSSSGKETIRLVDYPWGTLPILRIGRFYVDGLPVNGPIPRPHHHLSIVDFQDGVICKAFDLPRRLYDFRKNKDIGLEKLWRFKAGGMTCYIPCIELIRAFLTPSKTLANRLLAPHGLDSLIKQASGDNGKLMVLLSGDVPVTLVNDYFISHLLWLYLDETARSVWESIYRNIFEEAIMLDPTSPSAKLRAAIKLQMRPPIKGPCDLTFTGAIDRNVCLIFEITKVKGMPALPFEEVVYGHPSTKPKKAGKSVEQRQMPREQSIIYEMDIEHRSVRKDSYQPVVAANVTVMEFGHMPNLIRGNPNEVESEINSASTSGASVYPIIKLAAKEIPKLASTAESSIGGKISPLEFAGMRLTASNDIRGLEGFLNAVRQLAERYSSIIFESAIYELPGNKSFSQLYDGSRRTCAIIRALQQGIHPKFILEVARPDFWSISTLFIDFIVDVSLTNTIEGEILGLIEEIIQKEGHWNVAKLEQAITSKFLLLKHNANRSVWTWSQRILDKLSLLGIRPI